MVVVSYVGDWREIFIFLKNSLKIVSSSFGGTRSGAEDDIDSSSGFDKLAFRVVVSHHLILSLPAIQIYFIQQSITVRFISLWSSPISTHMSLSSFRSNSSKKLIKPLLKFYLAPSPLHFFFMLDELYCLQRLISLAKEPHIQITYISLTQPMNLFIDGYVRRFVYINTTRTWRQIKI